MDNKVYVITHKECKIPKLTGYKRLAVGARGKKFPKEYERDDLGDNISEYNNSYCELTGLYWMWKNDISKHIGLVHYRRFFVDVDYKFKFKGRYVFGKNKKYSIMTIDRLEEELVGYDLLIKMSDKKRITNAQLFQQFLGKEIWDELNTVIENGSRKYIDAFNELSTKKQHVNCNMFYGKKGVVDSYCEWLFNILGKVDEIHVNKCGNRYKNREIGYIGELLFGVWLNAEKIAYKELPVMNTGDDYAMDGALNLLQFFRFMIIKPLNHMFKLSIK